MRAVIIRSAAQITAFSGSESNVINKLAKSAPALVGRLAAENWHTCPLKPKEAAERRSQWCLCCCAEERQVPAVSISLQLPLESTRKILLPMHALSWASTWPVLQVLAQVCYEGDTTRVSPPILPRAWGGSASALTLKGITLPAQTHGLDGKPVHPEPQRDLLSCFFHLYSTQYS